jgi:hypothetical protein
MKLSVHLSYQIITTTKNKTNMTTETEFDYMSLYTMATFVEEKTEVETIINAEEKKPKKECRRCSGYGRIDAYTHIKGGVCFSCNGSGKK